MRPVRFRRTPSMGGHGGGHDVARPPGLRVQQFAIWTITDNPTKDGYVGIGSFGFGSGPGKTELARIKALFKAAGIPTTKYRALMTAQSAR